MVPPPITGPHTGGGVEVDDGGFGGRWDGCCCNNASLSGDLSSCHHRLHQWWVQRCHYHMCWSVSAHISDNKAVLNQPLPPSMEILLVICLFMTPFKLPGFNSERRFAISFSFSSVHSSVHSDESCAHICACICSCSACALSQACPQAMHLCCVWIMMAIILLRCRQCHTSISIHRPSVRLWERTQRHHLTKLPIIPGMPGHR